MSSKAAIIRYCEYQERCHVEVRNKLYELGCKTPEVNELMAELIENNLLNEERFARSFARGKFRMKQWGRNKIKNELRLRKISDYCLKKAMTEIDAEEYDKTLKKLAEKKAFALKHEKSEPLKKAKLYRYLLQKGFEQDLISDCINEVIIKIS